MSGAVTSRVVRIALRDGRLGRGRSVVVVLERVVWLMEFRRSRGVATRDGWCVQVCQSWLADVVGVRRESVSRLLGLLEAMGYLRVWRRRGVGGRYEVSWYGLGHWVRALVSRFSGIGRSQSDRSPNHRSLTVIDRSHGGGGGCVGEVRDPRLAAVLARLLERLGGGP